MTRISGFSWERCTRASISQEAFLETKKMYRFVDLCRQTLELPYLKQSFPLLSKLFCDSTFILEFGLPNKCLIAALKVKSLIQEKRWQVNKRKLTVAVCDTFARLPQAIETLVKIKDFLLPRSAFKLHPALYTAGHLFDIAGSSLRLFRSSVKCYNAPEHLCERLYHLSKVITALIFGSLALLSLFSSFSVIAYSAAMMPCLEIGAYLIDMALEGFVKDLPHAG